MKKQINKITIGILGIILVIALSVFIGQYRKTAKANAYNEANQIEVGVLAKRTISPKEQKVFGIVGGVILGLSIVPAIGMFFVTKRKNKKMEEAKKKLAEIEAAKVKNKTIEENNDAENKNT